MYVLKTQILNFLELQIQEKIDTATRAIQSAKEARDNETKSSVGDKYETGRAMMQLEQQRHEAQLMKALQLKKELSQINTAKRYEQVELGSLVRTDRGVYFISIGLGKVVLDDETYFAISVAAPIAEVMLGKKVGDDFEFNGNTMRVIEIG